LSEAPKAFCCAAPFARLLSNLIVTDYDRLLIEVGLQPAIIDKSARFLHPASGIALQSADAAHGKSPVVERYYRRCH
jgi:hypothetical protein